MKKLLLLPLLFISPLSACRSAKRKHDKPVTKSHTLKKTVIDKKSTADKPRLVKKETVTTSVVKEY